jgi:hypothetical protein
MSYVCNDSASASAARLLARRVSQLFAAAPMHFLLIFYVLATEKAATQSWGSPKIHSQVLTSYTWLHWGLLILLMKF